MALLALFLALSNGLLGFNAPEGVAGPIAFAVEGPAAIDSDAARVRVKLKNTGDAPCRARIQVETIDGWRVSPAVEVGTEVTPGTPFAAPFDLALTPDTLNALYPVRVCVTTDAGEDEAILIVPVERANPPVPGRDLPWQPQALPEEGRVALWRMPIRRTGVRVFGRDAATVMPVGWSGTEAETKADIRFNELVALDDTRRTIRMHPPWWAGKVGSTWTDYYLQLPDGKIRLAFDYAIAPNREDEPPSDGVTFRVTVAAPDGTTLATVFDAHTDAKTWQPAEADLSAYAGQAVLLRLEADPGPARDTTCDRGCWGEPTLLLGESEPKAPAPVAVETGRGIGAITREGQRYNVMLWPGDPGRPGHRIGFERDRSILYAEGLEVTIDGDRVDAADSVTPVLRTEEEKLENGVVFTYTLAHWAGPVKLRVAYRVDGGALHIACTLPERPEDAPWRAVRIDDVALGPWNRSVTAFYGGVGNVVVEPEAFTLPFDGHQLATSFVGHDFAGGWSLVQGVDVPPSNYECTPARNRATIHAAHDQTVTLVPAANVWDAARTWREHRNRGQERPAGFERLAGRFVFDLWGGRYGANRDALEKAFAYGLKGSAVVWHAWQRWGYDYRLPDIWPPNPDLGTEAELRALADFCRDNGVLFAPHDNYIDIYPDASCFTYDHVAFHGDGTPVRAWYNEYRDAQSYRWNPDAVRPHLEANVDRIREGLAPTAYFIDVWSSIRPHEYWTRDGRFVDHVYTRDLWGNYFGWIRERLGKAPQISESGHDQLVGMLDGAQCNHLRVAPEGEKFAWRVKCADAERIPWIDFAYHDRFALHGAGYPGRYDGGLDPRTHGVYSDDYLATEVLTGHPPMVSHAFSRDVVRKYWLLHDVMAALAGREMADVTFDDGDIHRQRVTWYGGAEAVVNRGDTDWAVDGRVLPPYGFYVRVDLAAPGGVAEAAVERIDGQVVEWSRGPDGRYINARMPSRGGPRVAGRVAGCTLPEPGVVALDLAWEVRHPIPEDLTIFVHLVDEEGEIILQGDHRPDPPTTTWRRGEARSVSFVELADDTRPGDTYDLRLGFYDPVLGRFNYIEGARDSHRRAHFGSLRFTGEGDRVTGAVWTPPAPYVDPLLARSNPQARPVDFGDIVTAGGLRVQRRGDAVLVTPLPDGLDFTVLLKTGVSPAGRADVLGLDGKVLGEKPLPPSDTGVLLLCEEGVFAYRVGP